MSRRRSRLSLWLIILLSSEVFAIGLGEIKLDSALNEPLRAEIELLSATPEELADLKVSLASSETFERYGIDRPVFLHEVEFNIVDGGVDGSVVQIRSRAPMSEPFVTFLIEASWPSGRLLREYTVLLDPPTYGPPAVQQAPAVEAPRRSTPSDSGRIERQTAATPEPSRAPVESAPAPRPADPAPSDTDSYVESAPQSRSGPAVDTPSAYSSYDGGDFHIEKGHTLWSVAAHLRPDSRLTINQTMLAIYEANPDAFGGNINVMKAGARLRIPSVDQVFQIERSDALSEVQRQHRAWGGGSGYTAPEPSTRPGLTLVPPDEDSLSGEYDDSSTAETPSREEAIQNRISDLEAADVPNQQSLISIRDNELATLRRELADIRGEVYEAPVSDAVVDDAIVEDDPLVEDPFVDDVGADEEIADEVDDSPVVDDAGSQDDAQADASVPTNIITTSSSQDEGIVDQILEFLKNWGIIIAVLIVVAGGLIWFVRRGGKDGEDENSRSWEPLDSDEVEPGSISATAIIRAPTPEEAMVVVEEDSGVAQMIDDTIEAPVADFSPDDGGSAGPSGSIEDTFSGDTAVNLDQSDPIAEADFHMAYGLYDQAADLINGALKTDSTNEALLSKLCEIYFVWGNRAEFVDTAGRLKNVVGEDESAGWHKIVIMGQQIAADDPLFAGAEMANATRDVDLSFEADGEEASALDMDFGADGGDSSGLDADIVATQGDVDFVFDEPLTETIVEENMDFDLDVTAQTPTVDLPAVEPTAEMPSLDDVSEPAMTSSAHESEETAEINLDDLDLGMGDFDAAEVASVDDLDVTGRNEVLSDTGINEALADLESTVLTGALDLDDVNDTGMRLAADETGQRPLVSIEEQEPMSLDVDDSLLESTGLTQGLKEDFDVDVAAGLEAELPADAETMLAPLDDDDDFDFSKTEALPPEAFTGILDLESTVEKPAIAGTDVDLDLDDLTAALKVSEIGDEFELPRDDVTTKAPDATGGDLHEARTMTEVGTKLDLARAYVDMGDPAGARSILDEVLDEGDEGQKQQAQQLLDSLPS